MLKIRRMFYALWDKPGLEIYAVESGSVLYVHPVHVSLFNTFLRGRSEPILLGDAVYRPGVEVIGEAMCPPYAPMTTRWERFKREWKR